MLKEAGQALASLGEESFAALVASVGEYAIFVLDAHGMVASWNEGAERIKGYRASEIIGQPYEVFFSPEDRAAGAPARALRAAAELRRFLDVGWRVRKDGSRFLASVVLTALRNPDGSVRGYLKVMRDITAQHGAERRVAALAEISQLALHELEIDRLFERTAALVARALRVEYVKFLELMPSGKALRLVAGFGWKDGLVGLARVPASVNSQAGYTLYAEELAMNDGRALRDVVMVDDLAAESRFRASKLLREHGVNSGMSVALTCDARPYGVLGAHAKARRRFDVDEAGFLQAVANVVSTAIERRRGAERLRESEQRLQAFMNFSPSAMFIKDRAGRYLHANDEFLRRVGLRREQVVGRTDRAIFPRPQALRFAENDAAVLALGTPIQVEETARYTDGEHVSLVSKFPIRDAQGYIVAVGGIATDISERKRAERALSESRAQLAEAQKLAGLGYWEWDMESGRLVWSDELYRIYGVTQRSFRPSFEGYLERVHELDRRAVRRALEYAVAKGGEFEFQERIVRPDGEIRHLRSHGKVVCGERVKALKLTGACLDVTEQVRTEAALRESAKKLQALAARLVGAQEDERRRIARELHDRVGQNLTALDINLGIAHDRLGTEGRDDVRRRIEDSRAVVEATSKTIEDVMADLRPPMLDDHGLAAALRWYAQEYSRRSGIEIRLVEHGSPRGARDPEAEIALFRIAQEALNNVAKHARAGKVEVGLYCGAGETTLRVADDGAGFDPSSSAARRGWGMSTMRERAEAFGGRLEVESAPGSGTVVTAKVKA